MQAFKKRKGGTWDGVKKKVKSRERKVLSRQGKEEINKKKYYKRFLLL